MIFTKRLFYLVFLLSCSLVFSQVGIGTTEPESSSMLEVKSAAKGVLLPRVSLTSTTDVTTIVSPAKSLLVYNTNTANDVVAGFYYWDGVWIPLRTTNSPSAGTNWSLGGNTISSSDFIGSVNYNPLQFRVNNTAFGRFHPNGGLALGNGAIANDNHSVAIGTGANSAANNQATAIGPSANATGFQSAAIGYQSYTSNNSTMALGKGAQATGFQATSVGVDAVATGQNSTAVGYAASAGQANSIILGSSTNASNKVGIGTNTPDERLHVVGSIKMVDGNQAIGHVLVSDAGGKARWHDPNSSNCYGQIYYSGTGQVLNQFNNITFGSSSAIKNITVNSDGITVATSGVYKIFYTVCFTKNSGSTVTPVFSLYKNYSTAIDGSKSSASIGNNETVTLSNNVVTSLQAFDKVSLRSLISDANISINSAGTAITIEKIE